MSLPWTAAHSSETAAGRLQFLDAMRAAAMLIVVLGHSGISLMRHPLPGLLCSALGRNLRGARRIPLLAEDRRSTIPSDALSAEVSSLAD